MGCAAVLALLAGCGSGPGAPAAAANGGAAVAQGGGARSAPSLPAARVAFRPGDGARDVSPLTPVVVSAVGGTLRGVVVRNAIGDTGLCNRW